MQGKSVKISKKMMQNMKGLVRYTMPNSEENKLRKSILTRIRKAKEETDHQCLYRGCIKPSAGSHEITKSIFIEPLSLNRTKVHKLKKAFKGNVNYFEYDFDRTSDCTVFKGFCSKHDSDLFKSFENDRNFEINSAFILKQSLRTLRREIYDLERDLHLLSKSKKTLKYFFIKYHLKVHFKRMSNLFDKISFLIEEGVDDGLFIEKIENIPQTKVQFADVITEYDSLRNTGDASNTFIFVFLFYVNGQQNLILACLGTDKKSVSRLEKIKNSPFIVLNKFILDHKEKMVLSEYFIDRLKAGKCENKFLEDTNCILNPYVPNFVSKELNSVLLFSADGKPVEVTLFD